MSSETDTHDTVRRDGPALKLLAGVLVLAHAAWICAHLWLVSEGRINPWKLGGYGMYTVPHPEPLTHVFVFDERSGGWAEIPREAGQFASYRFDTANDLHVFRCRPPDGDALARFFDENPHLRFRPLTIVLSEVQFDRAPVSAFREPHAQIQIAWGGRTRFGWQGQLCGETFTGERAYRPPIRSGGGRERPAAASAPAPEAGTQGQAAGASG